MKKSPDEIKKFYRKREVVENYDKKRFVGRGGEYINRNELRPILSAITKIGMEDARLRILDLGAGRGRLSTPIFERGHEVYCLDSSSEMIKILTNKFNEKHVFQQSAFDPIKTRKKFDIVTSLRFFDHFSLEGQRKILRNIKEVLAEDGYVIFATLNKYSLEFLLSKLFSYKKNNYYYTNSDYHKLFIDQGFKVISCDPRFFIPRGIFLHLGKSPWIFKLLSFFDKTITKFMPQLSCYYVYTIKKE